LCLMFALVLCVSRSAPAQFSQQGPKLVAVDAIGLSIAQGWAVATSADGNTAAVGGFGDDGNVGAVWIYVRTDGAWSQQGTKLVGTDRVGESFQGYSVAMSGDGNTVVVGAPGDNAGDGATWIFFRSGVTWTQEGGKLVGTGAVKGPNGEGVAQGSSVAIS